MKNSRFPHPLTLLSGCILAAAALSYVLPAGEFQRRDDPRTGRSVVMAGTYHQVESSPVNFFDAVVAIPKGMGEAADVIFLVFLIGGAFTVVDKTGALRNGMGWLVRTLDGRTILVIPIVSLAFATGGVLEHMQEEIIALVPVLLVLTRRLGFTPLTAISMSAGAAFVGSAFSPINPFQVGIAQRLAELPPLSGWAFRMVFLALALGFWIWTTMRYAVKTQTEPEIIEGDEDRPVSSRDVIVLGLVLATFAVLVYGLLELGWDFDHMSALFFIMGAVAGIVGGLKIAGTAQAYVTGFREMAYAALLIGFARAIFVVLEQGHIVDTIVNGLFTPLAELPLGLSAMGMVAAHTLVHVPVPSVSGQAVLTMPLLVPLSDLLGMSRQVTVLAYQYGAGLCDLVTPTNGALLAILAAGGVGFEEWFKFALPRYLALVALGGAAIAVALATGLQ